MTRTVQHSKSRYRYCPRPNAYGQRTVAVRLDNEDWKVWKRYVLAKGQPATVLGRKAIMCLARAELDIADAVAAAKRGEPSAMEAELLRTLAKAGK